MNVIKPIKAVALSQLPPECAALCWHRAQAEKQHGLNGNFTGVGAQQSTCLSAWSEISQSKKGEVGGIG